MQKAYRINLGKSDRKINKFSCRELTCSPNNSKNDKLPAQLLYKNKHGGLALRNMTKADLHSKNSFKIGVRRSRQDAGKLNPSLYISELDYQYILPSVWYVSGG